MRVNIEINIQDAQWNTFWQDLENELEEVSKQVLLTESLLKDIEEIEISLLLTNNNEIQQLNRDFRNKDKPTNVLSFPEYEAKELKSLEITSLNNYIYLGDIAMSFDVISSEADEKAISFKDHFLHLFVHSMLHLLGYDHIDDSEASVMEKLEIEILHKLGVKSPYILD